MKIRLANNADIAQLRALWKENFFDTDDYLDLYFSKRFCADLTVVLESEQEIIGMLHLLPCRIFPNQKALYWYAACISRAHRRKGLFRMMARSVLKETEKRGIYNVCLPAKGLESVYEKLGFLSGYQVSETLYQKDFSELRQPQSVLFEEAKADDFLLLSSENGSVLWDIAAIEYALEENAFCGGKTIRFAWNHTQYFAMVICHEETIVLENTNITEIVAAELKNEICAHLKIERFLLRRAFRNENACCERGRTDFPQLNEKAYLGFTLS